MTTIATVIIVIVAVIGGTLLLTQTGWLNQNTTTDRLAANETDGSNLLQNTTTDIPTDIPAANETDGSNLKQNTTGDEVDSGTEGVRGNETTQSDTIRPTGTNQTAKQLLYRNVSAIMGMETRSIEIDLQQPLIKNATHWITGTITLNEDLLDANDDKNLNIKILGWYKFKHGSDWIPICEDWVGSTAFGEKMISNLKEPSEERVSEDSDGVTCVFQHSYSKIMLELNNERSSYEKTVTLDLFVLSSTVGTTAEKGQ